jgi:hypothetical protein
MLKNENVETEIAAAILRAYKKATRILESKGTQHSRLMRAVRPIGVELIEVMRLMAVDS